MSDPIGRIKDSVADARSRKLIFLSHCLLNQNACVPGIASEPAAITPLVTALLEDQVGMYQMPCPEMTYYGSLRWGQVKKQYATPMFRAHCRRIAEQVCDQIQDYQASSHDVIGFVMRDGSPTCGLHRACVEADDAQQWGGMVWKVPVQRFAATMGVFCEELKAEVERRGIQGVELLSLPEVPEAGSFDDALVQIRTATGRPARTRRSDGA
jgi:predicted secreted protein